MSTIFTKIINGEIPCHKIYEDDEFLAFLDIRPVAHGHTLVIPKKEVDYIFDLDDALLGKLMVCAKKVAKMIEREVECEKIGVMVAGLEVPHTHIHLIPINGVMDLNFANAKDADQKVLIDLAERIKAKSA